MVTMCSNFPQK